MLKEAGFKKKQFRMGLDGIINSSVGGKLLQLFSGGSGMVKKCTAVGGHFSHVIATGNGDIMRQVATLMGEGRMRAVIDSTYDLEHAVDAILKQKAGRCAGKVVVKIGTNEVAAANTAAASADTTAAAAASADTAVKDFAE